MEHVLTTARGTSLGQRSGGQGRPTFYRFSTLVMMNVISMMGNPANDFTTYDFTNRSNIKEHIHYWNPTCAVHLIVTENSKSLSMGNPCS